MRLNRTSVLIFFLALILGAIAIAIWMPYKTKIRNLDYTIYDQNNDFQFEVGEKLDFIISDTTAFKNYKMVWQFGNGDSIVKSKNVSYTYKKEGKYLVTLKIDDKYKYPKYIDIINVKTNTAIDSVATIIGVDKARVNEQLVFLTNTPGIKSWYWEFGETGTIDAYERQVIYTYKKPGIYNVKLKTNQSEYPVYHRIEILPLFEALNLEPIDSLSIIENDIKERLQAIADANVSNKGVYYKNTKYIEEEYLCNKKEVAVVINENKYNDFYSYCQGLHYLSGKGSKGIIINDVKVDTVRCGKLGVKRIEVTQSLLK